MTYINITNFVLINQLEKDHSMTERHRLKNVVMVAINLKVKSLMQKQNKMN